MLKVLITGTSTGIGRATAIEFLKEDFIVYGIDIQEATINHNNYIHYKVDVSKEKDLPELKNINIIINNAGSIDESKAIDTNLIGYINIAEKYAFQDKIKSVINVASISGHIGLDTPKYSASQGGRLAYTKNLAIRLGKEYKATVNSISPGAVLSNLEPELYKQESLVNAVAEENILKKWATPEEIAKWIYFVAVINKSMTGQDILIDNGEVANYNFIKVRRE